MTNTENMAQALFNVDFGVSALGMMLHVRATDGLSEEGEASLARTMDTLAKHTKELTNHMEEIGVQL
jgi:hypothetical protein